MPSNKSNDVFGSQSDRQPTKN